MTNTPVLALEKRLFLFSLPGLVVAFAVIALGWLAAVNGQTSVKRTIEAQTQFLESGNEAVKEWRDALVEIEKTGEASSPFDARPMNIRMPAALPPAPLADFAIGSNDLHPTTTTLTGWSNPGDLFIEYEFSNPTLASIGGFDLTFLVVALLPLIMIGASFDILAGDRERGRARLIAAQAGHVGPSVWKRLVIRNLAIWACFGLVATLAAFSSPFNATPNTTGPARFTHFAAWFAAASVYGLFWLSLIAFAAAVIKRSETVAASLFASWAVFVFAVPAIGGALAEASYPPPSRLVFLSEMREGEVTAIRETAALTAGFLADHPEMTVSEEAVPGFYRSNFLANREAARRTTPVLEAFNQSRHQRAQLISKLQYLSPAMIANNALTTIAGGDVARNMAFQEQARAALNDLSERIGPAVVAKQRLSVAEFDAIPAFAFRERTLAEKAAVFAAPLGFLVLVAAVLLFASRRRLGAPLEKLL